MFSETTLHFFDLDGGPPVPKRAREGWTESPPYRFAMALCSAELAIP
jgi:hypothetical protein